MLVIVWLLPVPGGPCSTKLLSSESATAEYCDESAPMGSRMSSSIASSTERNPPSASAAVNSGCPEVSARISLLERKPSISVRTSFHIL